MTVILPVGLAIFLHVVVSIVMVRITLFVVTMDTRVEVVSILTNTLIGIQEWLLQVLKVFANGQVQSVRALMEVVPTTKHVFVELLYAQ